MKVFKLAHFLVKEIMSKKNHKFQNQQSKQIKNPSPKEVVHSAANKAGTADKPISAATKWMGITVIVLAGFFAYSPTLNNDYTNWDDNSYVAQMYALEKLNWEGVKERFHEYHMGNYHPLTMLSLSVDYNLSEMRKASDPDSPRPYEPDPFLFHLNNLMLHLAITFVVFWWVWLLFSAPVFASTVGKYRFEATLIVAALFALHPMHVESVAWVSERKDVLYTLFFVSSLYFYTSYALNGGWWKYGTAIFLFLLSLLSKGQAVSLAPTVVLIDWVASRKLISLKVILEKIPFFGLSLIFGIVAIKAQQSGNAIADIADYYWPERIVFAAYGTFQYIVKQVVPTGLAPLYPYPFKSGELPLAWWLYLLPVLALLYGTWIAFKKNMGVFLGIMFFLVNIFLLLQLLPVGSAVMADRYSYIPSIGLYIVAAMGYIYVSRKYRIIPSTFLKGAVVVYIAVLGGLTAVQSEVWKDSMTLWNHTLKLQPKAVVAWNNRGTTKEKFKDHLGAISDFDEAIKLKPDYTHAYYNRGTAYKEQAQLVATPQERDNLIKKALDDFDKALLFDPAFAEAYHNKGVTYDIAGDLQAAHKALSKAIELNPINPDPYINRGVVFGKLGKTDSSIMDFNKSLELKPNNASAYSNRGLAKDLSGDTLGSIADYSKAIEADADFQTAYSNRGIVRMKLKDWNGAINDFTKSVELKPEFADGYYLRASCYLELKNNAQACADFALAKQLGHPRADQQLALHCK